jgi:hypothetical protein
LRRIDAARIKEQLRRAGNNVPALADFETWPIARINTAKSQTGRRAGTSSGSS